jgi:sortase A
LTAGALLLALVGTGLLAYPFATDLWAARLQRGLSGGLSAAADDYRAGKIKPGDALTRLEIPKFDVDVVVVQGTSLAALRAGAGHYPATPLPGEPGNVAIAGHRTTYGRPFHRMDELVRGDKVILTTPIARHVYEITGDPFVVEPTDWSPIDDFPRGGSFLTLTSCHPEGSADYRIIARARLIRTSDTIALTGRTS